MATSSDALRTVTAVRYVTPLRGGGSVPGIVEADDLGTYVVKFTGSAQGRKALVAEVIVGELARQLGFRTPELVLVQFDPAVAREEPHQEVQDLLRASAGLNLGVDHLPGAADFTPGALDVDPAEAARIVWLDAFTANVDRTVHSPNLMTWPTSGHRPPRLWLIDHGAALVFHHRWADAADAAGRAYDVRWHALGSRHLDLETADADLAHRVTPELLRQVVAAVPDVWLAGEPGFSGPDEVREAYVRHLAARAKLSDRWLLNGQAPPSEPCPQPATTLQCTAKQECG
ncbi:HipA family kinase [Streptomyces sp. NRRL S-1448]|uniref:HipA family kinase n=1 Tax=Streptomyces sp. NRRL S-1448 TaxID=1463883 RepID=UPI000AE84DED|nr:HipA family kinase [Streptomyces sp. NRRL S-1448]